MKNIKKIEYKRISYDETKEKLEKMIEELKTIKDFEKFLKIVREIIELQNEIEEMYDYADIQNMRALDDEFYKEEVEYWNATKPKFDVLFVGDDWYESDSWKIMENKFKEVNVRVIYFPYTKGTSSTLINEILIKTRDNI